MLRTALTAAVAAATTAFAAPAATAAHATTACVVVAADDPNVPWRRFDGYLAGFATADSPVSVTCRVTRNGVTVAATPPGAGPNAAATYGAVSIPAGPDDAIEVCADVADASGSTTRCGAAREVPPQVLYDTIDAAYEWFWSSADLMDCELLKALAGNYGDGVLVINSQGDVYLNGEPQNDCPPYDIDREDPPPRELPLLLAGAVRNFP